MRWDAMVAEFKRRRDAVVKGLNTIPGFRCPVPAGAFYVFPNVKGRAWVPRNWPTTFCMRAAWRVSTANVSAPKGDGYLRFSYANSLENITEAVERIRKVSTKWATMA